ncbi:formyl transferase [Burkholderia sp. Ax-1719]|uniref:formyl transferase n=1 Tax=Burkholderia sp. Ax-1719 TaxID=2608334 RepID=UPI00141F0E80|nr:formyl transferase [Burkholderia sp. Ax-1719]NIE65418.1 formyl transferase [Burkholderia sp. Ax-1719]
MPSITVLCSDGPHHLYLAAALLETFGELCIVVEPSHAQARELRRRGFYRSWLWTHYHDLRRKLFGYDRLRRDYFRHTRGPASWKALRAHPGVRYVEVPSINHARVAETLRSTQSSAYIVMGTKRISEAVLAEIPSQRIVNVHGGHLPEYKGNHCFFFALHHGDLDKLSTTVHRVATGLDTGEIVFRHTVQYVAGDSSETLYSRAERGAIDRLVERLVREPDVSRWSSEAQETIGNTWRMRDRGPRVELAHHLVRRPRHEARALARLNTTETESLH